MPTLADVAAAAGVSIATVSKALTGRNDRIPAETVARVRQAAARLDYRPHALAQAVRRGRSACIGMLPNVLLKHDRFDQFWPRLQLGVERGLRRRGYDLLLVGGEDLADACHRLGEARLGRQVDGLVLPALPGLESLPQPAGPAVQVAGRPHPDLPTVLLDPKPGLTAAVDHVRHRGFHHLLAIELGIDGRTQLPERGDHVQSFGLPCTRLVITRPWSGQAVPETAIAALATLLEVKLRNLPDGTAICAANDLVAHACLRLLRPRVPRGIAIIGFDDTGADLGDPPLSTISHELVEMGLAAAELVADAIDGHPVADRLIPSRFIPRETT